MWAAGWERLYFAAMHLLDTDAFRFPFLDTHALLSAAECHRQGINVYRENPCDVIGRVHAYSPVWLWLTPDFLGPADTNKVGLALDLAFIASLGIVFRPRSWSEAAIFAVAVFSPVTLYATERANNDIIIFILVAVAALLWSKSARSRSVSYLIYLFAGLLKYYPMFLLVLAARERWWRTAAFAMVSGLAIALLVVADRAELVMALGNIPTGTHFSDSFSARNLPFGIVELVAGAAAGSAKLVAASLLLAMSAAAAVSGWRTARPIGALPIDWTVWEMRLLAAASVLLPVCFFTALNITYRGIYFLLAMPGLLALGRATRNGPLERWPAQMLGAILFLIWGRAIFRGLEALLGLVDPELAGSAFHFLARYFYWFARELVWWWLIAGFLAMAIACIRSLPLSQQIIARLRPLLPPSLRR